MQELLETFDNPLDLSEWFNAESSFPAYAEVYPSKLKRNRAAADRHRVGGQRLAIDKEYLQMAQDAIENNGVYYGKFCTWKKTNNDKNRR